MAALSGALLGAVLGLVVNGLADWFAALGLGATPTCPRCGAPQPLGANWRPCVACGRRDWRPWVVLALMVGYGALVLRDGGSVMQVALRLVSGAYFLLVAVVDVEHRLIPYEEAALGALLGLGVGVLRRGWGATLAGALGGLLIMGTFYWLGERYMLWRARRRGDPPPEEPALGFGDVYLSGVLGLFLGWPGIVGGLMVGFLAAGAFSLLVLLVAWRRGRTWDQIFLPLAPFLVGAAWLLLLQALG